MSFNFYAELQSWFGVKWGDDEKEKLDDVLHGLTVKQQEILLETLLDAHKGGKPLAADVRRAKSKAQESVAFIEAAEKRVRLEHHEEPKCGSVAYINNKQVMLTLCDEWRGVLAASREQRDAMCRKFYGLLRGYYDDRALAHDDRDLREGRTNIRTIVASQLWLIRTLLKRDGVPAEELRDIKPYWESSIGQFLTAVVKPASAA